MTAPASAVRPHRGGAVLALGIIGLVACFICGIIAWSMGNKDLREMAAGRMDRSGESLTRAGKVCGMISVILACAGIVIWLIAFVALGASTLFS
jgi:hypothetical protein